MKNTFFLILLLLSTTALGQNNKIYEAESATFSNDIKVIEENTASNNKYLVFEQNGSVKWKVNTLFSGWFNINIRYRAKMGDVAQGLDVNGKCYGMGFSICNNWCDAYHKTYLQKGENEITLWPDYGKMEIDYLSIPEDTFYLLPVLSPIAGIFYKDRPAAITIFANAMGKGLQSVSAPNLQINFKTNGFDFLQGAYHILLSKESLLSLPLGNNQLKLTFTDGSIAYFSVTVKETVKYSGLTFIMFDVEHGNSVLVFLPNGKRLLIDSGKDAIAKSVIMPFMDKQDVDTIHYFILTHYHDDHAGAREEIIKKYHVQNVFDYKSFKSGDSIKWGNTVITILNTFADGANENDRSMSLLLNWNGFTYSHGADNYANTQNRILKKFGNELSAQVFYANHHFHGSVNPNFIMKTNPALVVVSAEQSVYARGAYASVYKEQTEKALYAAHARLIETLLTLETGTVVIRVNNAGDWIYETYRNNNDIYLPKID